MRLIGLLAVCYFLADVAVNRFPWRQEWAVFWPLNGITVAILLCTPRTRWVTVLCGVESGLAIGELCDHVSIGIILGWRVLSVAEVLITAFILPPFQDAPSWLRTPNLLWRMLLALTVGPWLTGILAASYHQLLGQHYPWLAMLAGWASPDALGTAAALPLALAATTLEMRALWRLPHLPSTLLTLLTPLVLTGLLFSSTYGYLVLFLIAPVFLWANLRLKLAETSMAIFLCALLASWCTMRGYGPLAHLPPALGLDINAALQLYLGLHIFGLLRAVVVSNERQHLADELQIANDRLRALSITDGLTGIANRRAFEEFFAHEWGRAARNGTSLALLMIDIDHFKQYNDSYGHVAGDVSLQRVAAKLKTCARRSGDTTARLGGEEFAILLPALTLEGAAAVARTVRASIAELKIDHAFCQNGVLTLSVGYGACIPHPGQDRNVFLRSVDDALYVAKRLGRNREEPASAFTLNQIQ